MTTPQTTNQADGVVPVACSLAPAGLAAQAGRWARLIAQAMTSLTDAADGVHIAFRPGAAIEDELRRLVATETECCPWAAWAVETNAKATVLDVH